MQPLSIYLSGNISPDPRTRTWRRSYAAALVKLIDSKLNRADGWIEQSGLLNIVDPCATEFNKDLRAAADAGNTEHYEQARKQSQLILPDKDFQLMKTCNLMICNLELADPQKPPIGTTHELAWARDILRIPVIAIVGESPTIWSLHPFNARCIAYRCPDVYDALDVTVEFFV